MDHIYINSPLSPALIATIAPGVGMAIVAGYWNPAAHRRP